MNIGDQTAGFGNTAPPALSSDTERGVDDEHQPGGQRAELLSACADAAVQHWGFGVREIVRELPDGRRVDTARVGDGFRREVGGHRDHVVEPGDAALEMGGSAHPVVLVECAQDREQEQRVGAGPDRNPLRRALRGERPARIDDGDCAATAANCGEPCP